ncbi:MAG: helix-turn-helix transcriptional regulator [Planctomycetota bacterium]|nr:helix-turn-helix transcriptional regulator [Planctomycetota bacterium]
MAINRKYVGGSFDDFLKEQGIYDEVMKIAAKKRLALQFQREMKRRNITKTLMAKKLHTSRMQVNRILSPDNSAVSVETLERAASVLGCMLRIELQPARG